MAEIKKIKDSFSILFLVAVMILIFYYNYVFYHSIAILFSIIIGFCLFVIAWTSKKYVFFDFNFLTFIGTAYFFISLLDLFHLLTIDGMNVFHSTPMFSKQLWISSRMIESISFLIPIVFMRHVKKMHYKLTFVLYAIVTALILSLIFFTNLIPPCFTAENTPTTFKLMSEYLIAAIFVLDFILFGKKKSEFTPRVYRFIQIAILLSLVVELNFTLFYSNYLLSDFIGHMLKIFSYFCMYKAIIITCISEPYEIVFKDLKVKEIELSALAMYDSLTNVYNRHAADEFLNNLNESIKVHRNDHVVCYIDVDKLKYVNDNFGHSEGDNLLLHVVNFIKAELQSCDYLCRIGGDEFLIIFTNKNLHQATHIMKAIRSRMHQYNMEKAQSYKIDFSYGFAETRNQRIKDVNELLHLADDNMYQNKMQKRHITV